MLRNAKVRQCVQNHFVCLVYCGLLQACSGVWSPQTQKLEKLGGNSASIIAVTPKPVEPVTPIKGGVGEAKIPMLLSAHADLAIHNATNKDATTPPSSQTQQKSNTSTDPMPKVTGHSHDSILPQGVFGAPVKPGQSITKSTTSTAMAAGAMSLAMPTSPASKPTVLLYVSKTNKDYLGTLGIDASEAVQAWEFLLRKHAVPYTLINSVRDLDTATPTVLVLPSTVALSDQEKQSVVVFQRKGGAILSTWLTGVRDEYGDWRGFGFMENTLGAKVVGTTEEEDDDTYLVPHGDNPVSHSTPAGLRIWMARTAGWHPLRLVGKHSAADFMDWSRTLATGRHSSTIVFDERTHITGNKSRMVVLGFPEQLWASVDALALDPLILDALTWALRQPSAYVAAWPNPYSSAFALAIDAADTMTEADMRYGKLTGDLGGRATYFVLTEQAAQASVLLNKIRMEGHEIGYLGDRFEEFKGQSTGAQSKRIDTMLREMKNAGVEIAEPAGFHPPMESYDKTTEKIVRDRKFGYMIAGLDATESRLPLLIESDGKAPLILLPRTQSDPEDLLSQGDPAAGFRLFFSELNLADKMAGLSITRLSNRSSLTDSQFAEFSQHLKSRRDHIWMASGGQLAKWWLERANISATLDITTTPPLLSVNIHGNSPLQNAANIWVNLPESGLSLRLTPTKSPQHSPKITPIDVWRSAVVLTGFPPGEYHWHVHFDRHGESPSK